MGLGRTLGVALVALALLVSGRQAALDDVKVVEITKSIGEGKDVQNLISEDDLRLLGDKVNETQRLRDPSESWEFDRNGTDPRDAEGKPSKFDKDISGLIHTDSKSLHDVEALRLKAKSELQKRESNAGVESVVEKIGSSYTRRVDDDAADDATFAEAASHISERDPHAEHANRCDKSFSIGCLENDLEKLVDKMSSMNVYNLTDYIQIVKNSSNSEPEVTGRSISVLDKMQRYVREHVLKIKLPTALSVPSESRTFFGALFQGNSTFLTGFGLGFLAFGLKKLMLPFIIGMQIVKSVIIALFLPTILGTIGKIVGKSVSTFSQASQGAANQPEESFEFKDNADIYNDDYMHTQPIGTLPASAMYDQTPLGTGTKYMATPVANQRISYVNSVSDNYYSRNSMQGTTKQQNYKVFHDIPASSLLLTNYDPFYSPLLSRLDAVFSRLGHATEGCREYAICAMYRSPARYAPYSNLVSAQLSRELNELRKPTSDNPDVLRFFKYMKAAKDGQDGVRCEDIYTECASRGSSSEQNQAMLATYQDINKLVQARRF